MPKRPRVQASLSNPRIWFGGIILLSFIIMAIFAPFLAPHDPLKQDLMSSLLPPAWLAGSDASFPLGTDSLGRDVLSRIVFGARTALLVAISAATLAALLGTFLGLVAGFFGGWVDMLISRLVDIWMAFPAVLLSIVLVAVMGTGLHSVIIAIAIIDWTRFCRIIRSEVLVQKEQDYIASARNLGLSKWRMVFSEIMPNIWPLFLTLFTLELGIAIIVEAILSFVGLSLSSETPSWGGLIQEGRQIIYQAWWVMTAPIICLILVVMALNALGDGLRNVFDPVMQR
jgi:peptide/nickel transport system permease protein